MGENNPSTKTKIFNSALLLFGTRGVENATMRDIASAAGINIASIYNYYSSKEEILDSCYDFYIDFHDITKLDEAQYTKILRTGTKEEIVNIPNFQFPAELEQNLILAMTILFSRMYTDPKAIEKYSKMVDHSLEYLDKVFQRGIDIGRFEPFNKRGVSLLFLSARIFAAQSITIRPETLGDMGMVQHDMMQELINSIPFKY